MPPSGVDASQEGAAVTEPRETKAEREWRETLTSQTGLNPTLKRLLHRFPSAPRCKLCQAPFGPPSARLFSLFGWRRSTLNPRLCRFCIKSLEKLQGGAEVTLSVLFADVRGSTAVAEQMRPAEFSELLNRYYAAAEEAIDRAEGIVDKYLGDGVVALFLPVIAGAEHAHRAIDAGRGILQATGNLPGGTPWLPVGVGVDTGIAFVGGVGGGGQPLDFTALGDTVNTAARLGELAGAGQLLASVAVVEAADLRRPASEARLLQLKGRAQAVEVYDLATPGVV